MSQGTGSVTTASTGGREPADRSGSIPRPADLIPDATGLDAPTSVCRAAEKQPAVFIAVERQAPRWTVEADVLGAPQHAIDARCTTPYERPSSA